jgi:hypothetical protein
MFPVFRFLDDGVSNCRCHCTSRLALQEAVSLQLLQRYLGPLYNVQFRLLFGLKEEQWNFEG